MLPVADSQHQSEVISIYGVGPNDVILCPILFYVLYIPLAPLAVWMLRHTGLRTVMWAAAAATGAGCALRLGAIHATPGSFYWLVGGSAVLSLATPFVFSATTRLTTLWFAPAERSRATALLILANQFGLALGVLVPPAAVGHEDLRDLTILNGAEAAIGVVAMLCTFGLFGRDPPSAAPAPSSSAWEECKGALGAPGLWPLAVTFALMVGAYWTVTTLMNDILVPVGYSPSDVSIPAGAFLLAGIPGMFGAGMFIERTQQYDRGIAASGVVALGLMVAFAEVSSWQRSDGHLTALTVICALGGFAFAALQPMVLEKAAEVTYPQPESVSCGIVYLCSQFTGAALLAVTEGAPIRTVVWVLVGCTGAGLVAFVLGPKGTLHRLAAERSRSLEPSAERGGLELADV